MRKFHFILFFILLFSSCKNQEPSPVLNYFKSYQKPTVEEVLDESAETIENWRSELDKYFSNKHFNGNVLVAKKGAIIYEASFGVENIAADDSLTNQSLFQIASISKTFTAMAVMLLVEDGRLHLDQTIEEFFPDFPYKGVRIKDLLSHRSGLPNYLYTTEKVWNEDSLKDNKELLNYLIQYQPQIHHLPNRKFEYNNTNFALLPLIIEQVSGMPFEDFMKRRIFIPLNMNHTFIFSKHHPTLPSSHLTTGYQYRNRPDKIMPTDGIDGDKNIFTTTEDLLKWERANRYAGFFKQSTLDSVVVERSNEHPGIKNYGYGWRLVDEAGVGTVVFHNGWWHGYTGTFRMFPDEICVIVLSNFGDKSVYDVNPVWDILQHQVSDD
ncbi:MAG: beta-lactamase family protein [Chitinophagales bacterium]|nr:beta-lactamase family protein [Chitinophagales bacterium]